MDDIIIARCHLENLEGKIVKKICLFYGEKFYDIDTFKVYDIYEQNKLDSNYRVKVAEIIDESDFDADSLEWISIKKRELLKRLKNYTREDMVSETAALVVYSCNQVVLKDGNYDLEFQEQRYPGIVIGNTVYDLVTKSRVKTIDEDEIILGDLYLTKVYPVSKYLLDIEEQKQLLSIVLEISLFQKTDSPRIINMR